MKKIGMVLQDEFPPDIRVRREAKALIDKGFNVYLLSKKLENLKEEEVVDGIYVRRVLTRRKNKFFRKIDTLCFYSTAQYKTWGEEMKKFIRDFKIEALHIHDLPLLPTGIKVAEPIGIPIIADLHENYPAASKFYQTAKTAKSRFFNLFFPPGRWQSIERKYLKKVDKIIVVVKEAKERIIHYGIPEEKIFVISNVVDTDYFNSFEIDSEVTNRCRGEFIISYIGRFGPHRGIEIAIKAMGYFQEKTQNIKLLLVGKGNQGYEKYLKELVKNFMLEKSVKFVGWQPFSKVPSYIKVSDIGLIPHNKNPHTDSTMPNKLFHYMLMGKPVIVSSCKPLKRIIEETKCGLVFEAGNEGDLADKIFKLHDNRNFAEKLGENGRKAVEEKYNWKKESKKLLVVYKKMGCVPI